MATYHFHIIAENNDGFGVPSDVAGATADTPGVVTELRAMASMKQFCTQHPASAIRHDPPIPIGQIAKRFLHISEKPRKDSRIIHPSPQTNPNNLPPYPILIHLQIIKWEFSLRVYQAGYSD